MKKYLFAAVLLGLSVSMAGAYEGQTIQRTDPTCERSMRIVKSKFGTPDEFIQLSSNSMSIIFRDKGIHVTFEVVNSSCVVTTSTF